MAQSLMTSVSRNRSSRWLRVKALLEYPAPFFRCSAIASREATNEYASHAKPRIKKNCATLLPQTLAWATPYLISKMTNITRGRYIGESILLPVSVRQTIED